MQELSDWNERYERYLEESIKSLMDSVRTLCRLPIPSGWQVIEEGDPQGLVAVPILGASADHQDLRAYRSEDGRSVGFYWKRRWLKPTPNGCYHQRLSADEYSERVRVIVEGYAVPTLRDRFYPIGVPSESAELVVLDFRDLCYVSFWFDGVLALALVVVKNFHEPECLIGYRWVSNIPLERNVLLGYYLPLLWVFDPVYFWVVQGLTTYFG